MSSAHRRDAQLIHVSSISATTLDDEELLMQALMSLTTEPAPFITGNSNIRRDRTTNNNNNNSVDVREEEHETHKQPSSSSATTTTAAACGASAVPRLSAREEAAVLAAIHVAVDQQSSISGDWHVGERVHEIGEADAVEEVLHKASIVAAANVRRGRPPRRGASALHLHVHLALQESLQRLRTTSGVPTCVAMRPSSCVVAPTNNNNSNPHDDDSGGVGVAAAIGTSMGDVLLCDVRWCVVGICGAQQSRATALSIAHDGSICISGHESSALVMWSTQTRTALRVLHDHRSATIHGGVLRLRHFWMSSHACVVVHASGVAEVVQLATVMVARVARRTRLGCSASTSTMVADVDVIPYPSSSSSSLSARTRNNKSNAMKDEEGGDERVEVDVTHNTSSFIAKKHLAAAISVDGIHLYVVDEGGLHTTITLAALHPRNTTTTSSSSSSMTIAFCREDAEEDGGARWHICAAWGTSLLLLHLRVADAHQRTTELIPLATLHLKHHVMAIAPVDGSSVLVVDAQHSIHLVDVSVAVVAERVELISGLDGVVPTHNTTTTTTTSPPRSLLHVGGRGVVASNGCVATLLRAQQHLVSCRVLPWRTRLDALTAQQCFVEALELARSYADGVALSVAGRHPSRRVRQRQMRDAMEHILLSYLDAILPPQEERTRTRTPATTTTATSSSSSSTCVVGAPQVVYASDLVVLNEALVVCLTAISAMRCHAHLMEVLATRLAAVHQQDALWFALEECVMSGRVRNIAAQFLWPIFTFFAHPSATAAFDAAVVRQCIPTHEHHDDDDDDDDDDERTPVSRGRARAERVLMPLRGCEHALFRLATSEHLHRCTALILSLRWHKFSAAMSSLMRTMDGGEVAQQQQQQQRVVMEYVEATLRGSSLIPRVEYEAAVRATAKRSVWSYLEQHEDHLHQLIQHNGPRLATALVRSLHDRGDVHSPWTTETEEEKLQQHDVADDDDDDGRHFSILHHVDRIFRLISGGVGLFFLHPHNCARQRRNDVRDDRHHDAGAAKKKVVAFDPWALLHHPRGEGFYHATHILMDGVMDLIAPATTSSSSSLSQSVADTSTSSTTAPPTLARTHWLVVLPVMVRQHLFLHQRATNAAHRLHVEQRLMHLVQSIPHDDVLLKVVQPFADEMHLLGMARCVAAIYCRGGRYGEAMDAYLNPTHNAMEVGLARDVFQMLSTELQHLTHNSQRTTKKKKKSTGHEDAQRQRIASLHQALMQRVSVLVSVDSRGLTTFLRQHLPRGSLLKLLRDDSSADLLHYLNQLCSSRDAEIGHDMHLQHHYIHLLCAHQPQEVCRYLRNCEANIVYDLNVALMAVRRHHIADATVFLLQKLQRVEEAVEEMLLLVQERLRLLLAQLMDLVCAGEVGQARLKPTWCSRSLLREASLSSSSPSSSSLYGCVAAVREATRSCLELIMAHRSKTISTRMEQSWKLLNVFIVARRRLRAFAKASEQHEKGGLACVGMEALRKCIEALHPPSSSSCSTATPSSVGAGVVAAHAPTTFVDATPLVGTMLDLYLSQTSVVLHEMASITDIRRIVAALLDEYEEEPVQNMQPLMAELVAGLQHTANTSNMSLACASDYAAELGRRGRALRMQAMRPMSDQCLGCRGALTVDAGSSVDHTVCVFVCGHAFHVRCLPHGGGGGAAAVGSGRQRCCPTCDAVCIHTSPAAAHITNANTNNDVMSAGDDGRARLRKLRDVRSRLDCPEEARQQMQAMLAPMLASLHAPPPAGRGRTKTSPSPPPMLLATPPPPPPTAAATASEDVYQLGLTDAELLELFGE